jgi:hypothetical protein
MVHSISIHIDILILLQITTLTDILVILHTVLQLAGIGGGGVHPK